jgi:plasmid stability protein
MAYGSIGLIETDINDIIDISGERKMAALTVRNIDDDLKRDLRKQAAANNRSMEEEVRAALRSWVRQPKPHSGAGLGTRIRERFEALGRVELNAPARASEPLPGSKAKADA